MLARVATFALDGLDCRPVTVEVDVRPGLPAFTVVGLGDAAVRESRERVRAALLNSGFEFPARRITANLAPASLRKAGPGFDLGLAVGVLAASGQVPAAAMDRGVVGELSLSGSVRPCRGVLAAAQEARRSGLQELMVPREQAGEAALVPGLAVTAVATLGQAAAALRGDPPPAPEIPPDRPPPPPAIDLADVRGQDAAVRALEIAAAGGHNLLISGPPGAGKTMLARRLPTVLPPLSDEEAIEVTRIHSIAGLIQGGGLVRVRPFRAPHHSISAAGLVGGGVPPAPGEATLAHGGVLFLDELSEFPRPSLEALRQPLEDGAVVIVRGQRARRLPARFMLVAATNPCPCGHHGQGDRCRCSEAELERHRRRLSGPLLDRIDLLVAINRPAARELASPGGRNSRTVADRVAAARERQLARADATGASCNARLAPAALRRHAGFRTAAWAALDDAYDRSRLSARGRERAARVARTIADLEGRARVGRDDALNALGFRQDAAEGEAP
ncbi:MAG: YifB family Mg chelatase-like AAA ATPase [Solirubrobacteraceae bacterium]